MAIIFKTVYLEKETVAKLIKLSEKTRIPQSVLVREGVALMLMKWEKQWISKQKRRKTLKRGTKRECR